MPATYPPVPDRPPAKLRVQTATEALDATDVTVTPDSFELTVDAPGSGTARVEALVRGEVASR